MKSIEYYMEGKKEKEEILNLSMKDVYKRYNDIADVIDCLEMQLKKTNVKERIQADAIKVLKNLNKQSLEVIDLIYKYIHE